MLHAVPSGPITQSRLGKLMMQSPCAATRSLAVRRVRAVSKPHATDRGSMQVAVVCTQMQLKLIHSHFSSQQSAKQPNMQHRGRHLLPHEQLSLTTRSTTNNPVAPTQLWPCKWRGPPTLHRCLQQLLQLPVIDVLAYHTRQPL